MWKFGLGLDLKQLLLLLDYVDGIDHVNCSGPCCAPQHKQING